RREFVVDCAAPDPIRRLHVLPVVIRDKGDAAVDEKQLVDRLQQLVPSVAKAQLKVYPPLTRYVSANQITTQMMNIKAFLDATAAGGGTGDLVVIYYQGGEVIESDGHYLLTSVSVHNPNLQSSAVSVGSLTSLFGETLGAEIILFDLTRRAGEADKVYDAI